MNKNVKLACAALVAGCLLVGASDAQAAWSWSRNPVTKLVDNLASLCTLQFTNNTDRTLLMSIGPKEELVAPGGSVRNGVGTGETRALIAKDPKTKAIVYNSASGKATPGKTITRTIVVDKKTGKIVSG